MYSNRVLLGNWYESAKLQEYKLALSTKVKTGGMLLAKYRKMVENLEAPGTLTQTSTGIEFGNKISLCAPHLSSDKSAEGKKGILLGGQLSATELIHTQELIEGCRLVGYASHDVGECKTFAIMSADYCDRTDEKLKYNQEFLLALSCSLNKKPLYVRFDLEPCPGINENLPLFFSHNPVSSTRWRILPIQKPNITRFEQEGQNVPVNTDIVINHCATNLNLGINVDNRFMGFHGSVFAPEMKTCLDVFKRELPNNIWQIYIPIKS